MGKGAEYERVVCKMLSKWAGSDDVIFWRQILSGGWSKVSKKNLADAGDIKSIHPSGEFFTNYFSVELKRGYDASFDKILKNGKSEEIMAFWKQCTESAFIAKKQPMLIYKKDRQPAWIAINLQTAKDLYILDLPYPSLIVSFNLEHKLEKMVVMDMAEFFNFISPEMIQNLSKIIR